MHNGKSVNISKCDLGWRDQQIKVSTVKPSWLVDNWIGTTIEYCTIEELREDLLHLGFCSNCVRYLWDKAFLLIGNDGTQTTIFFIRIGKV